MTAGEVVRPARGVYALPELPEPLQAAHASHGVLSHLSAAVQHGWKVLLNPDRVHVTVPPNAHRRAHDGVRLHYAGVEAAELSAGRVTDALRTVLDCAATLPFAEALAVADSACRGGLDPLDLCAAARARSGRGAAAIRRVATHASPLAANPFESALRAIVLEARLGCFRPQLEVGGGGFRARADLGDEQHRILLEADSFSHHGDRAALERDCRRYDEYVRRDWAVLRFAWEHVMFRGSWVAAVVHDVHRLRG